MEIYLQAVEVNEGILAKKILENIQQKLLLRNINFTITQPP